MSHRFKFEVEVEVNRTEGKFASRDEIAEQLREALEGADPGSFSAGENGEYEVTEWSVNEVDVKPPAAGRAPGRG